MKVKKGEIKLIDEKRKWKRNISIEDSWSENEL